MSNKENLILCIALLVLGFFVGHRTFKNPPIAPVETKVDTLYVRDTITLQKPVYTERKVVERVAVPVNDTITLHDTLYMYLEREQLQWVDSLSVVYVSGIDPQVDSIQHYITYREIRKEYPVEYVKKTRWGIGINAGYGFGKDGMTPYVGLGVSYNLLSW